VLIGAAAGAVVAVAAHEVGALLIALSLVVVLVGLLFTLTAIGAVIGIPLMFAGALGVALGAASLGGTGSALVLGLIAGLLIYAVVRRRERRAAL
jgi:hypothetical protein